MKTKKWEISDILLVLGVTILSVLIALNVISSKFPIGVGTKYTLGLPS